MLLPTDTIPTRPPGRRQDPLQAATDWRPRAQAILASLPAAPPLPVFDPSTVLPTPQAFDEPIRSLEQTATTFEVLGGNLVRELAGVQWRCADATRFREQFTGERRPQLLARANDLRELAGTLRRIQARTADERAWIESIQREVRDYLSRVHAAFLAARNTAAEAVADAQQAHRSATSAVRNAAAGFGDLLRAGLDEATGGDGSDELARAARHAEAAVGDARRTLDAVVDFTTGWEFNGANLPYGVCRAWYDVDTYMARKSATAEAYGVSYRALGRYRP